MDHLHDEMENIDDDDCIVLVNEDGEELPMQILASRETADGMYVLAANEEEGEVAHFKCTPAGEEEVLFELVDAEHEEFEKVFELFKDDYETLGIEIEELDFDEELEG